MLGSRLSNQTGASIVAIRQWVAALVLLTVGKPRLRRFTAAQWRVVLALALIFAVKKLSLNMAIDRVGLGLAATLEFLGSLTVAVAGSRRLTNLLCALMAAGAVAILMRATPSTDYLGMYMALLAAVCWGYYILLNRSIGVRLPGLEGSAAAAMVSGVLYLPVGAWVLWHHPPTAAALGFAVAAGILSSAVPFLVDLLALGRVPAHSFGMFMIVNPVFAALIGLIVLGQRLDIIAWMAIVVSVCANVIALSTAHRSASRSMRRRASLAPPRLGSLPNTSK